MIINDLRVKLLLTMFKQQNVEKNLLKIPKTM